MQHKAAITEEQYRLFKDFLEESQLSSVLALQNPSNGSESIPCLTNQQLLLLQEIIMREKTSLVTLASLSQAVSHAYENTAMLDDDLNKLDNLSLIIKNTRDNTLSSHPVPKIQNEFIEQPVKRMRIKPEDREAWLAEKKRKKIAKDRRYRARLKQEREQGSGLIHALEEKIQKQQEVIQRQGQQLLELHMQLKMLKQKI